MASPPILRIPALAGQADLETADSGRVERESGLSGSNGRVDAVSSLAVTRIQVERAAP